MSSVTTRAHCLIIKEGFQGGRYPDAIQPYFVREYPHLLGRSESVTIGVFSVPQDAVLSVGVHLADALLPQRFYAHFVAGDRLVVAFPSCLAFVQRSDEQSAQRAQQIGTLFDIPVEQMAFLRLFEEDHPEGE